MPYSLRRHISIQTNKLQFPYDILSSGKLHSESEVRTTGEGLEAVKRAVGAVFQVCTSFTKPRSSIFAYRCLLQCVIGYMSKSAPTLHNLSTVAIHASHGRITRGKISKNSGLIL
jgi:hypothetical protein